MPIAITNYSSENKMSKFGAFAPVVSGKDQPTLIKIYDLCDVG